MQAVSIGAVMFYLQYRVSPGDAHPRREQLGEGLVCCWIDRPTLPEADRVARRTIRREKWDVLEREFGEPARDADHGDDEEWLRYYRQALTDKEVFAFNLSPRFPVYWVTASVGHKFSGEVAEAHYLLAGDSILQDGDDLYAPDFWSQELDQLAVDGMVEAIEAEGWVVTEVSHRRPCGRGDVPEELVFAYDEAEDSGSCLVFLRDGEGEADATASQSG
jgi:hypothetical protein